MNDFEYIKTTYKVPAEIGREIMFEGKRKGVIVEDKGNYIGVNFYDSKPSVVSPLHPTWEVEYLGMAKTKRKSNKGQQRYQEYIQADWFSGTFADWLGIKSKR